MAGKHITIAQKTEALTHRAAGYTITVISDRTGVSVSSLKRLFDEYGVSRGKLKIDTVEQARAALINDETVIEAIKREVAALILDDVALAKRLRQVMAEATEHLSATNPNEALQVMRAVSSGAVALKSTSETLRKSLGIDKDENLTDELPELTITIMTEDEINQVKRQARDRAFGLGQDEMFLAEDENEIIEFDEATLEEAHDHG